MAVKALRVGVGAWRIGVDVGARNAAARKLQRNRRNQIGVMLGPMHSRRDHAISEIRRRKRIGNLGSDLEIFRADARSNRRDATADISTLRMKRSNRRRNNARDHAAPTRVHRGNRASFGAGNKNRHAIGNAHQDRVAAAHAGERIRFRSRAQPVTRGNHSASVDLTRVDNACVARKPNCPREPCVILSERIVVITRLAAGDAGVGLQTLQIQRIKRRCAYAAHAR